MEEQLEQPSLKARLVRIAPLYAAAYAVLLCGLASYVTVDGDDTFGIRGILMVLTGLAVSLYCRLQRLKQNTMFGILAGMVVVLVFYVSLTGGTPLGVVMGYVMNGQSAGPGLMLAWFLMLYSFAMIANEVIIFSVVPSIALLGLVASENLNSEMVVYFVGLVFSAAFLLVYENTLSRAPEERPVDPPRNPHVSSALLLTVMVLALALCLGLGVSRPLQALGQSYNDRTMGRMAAPIQEFSADPANRTLNQLQLSGTPPRLSERVVMEVRTPEPFYWRDKVFDYYTGSAWTGDEGVREPLPLGGNVYALRPLDADPDHGEARARRLVRQVVRLRGAPIGGMLAAAGEPVRVQTSAALGEDAYRGLHASVQRSGLTYTVESMVPNPSDGDLRRASTSFPPGLRATYVQLNEENRGERYAIASKVTEGFHTQFDRVRALQRYLKENYTYTLTPPRTPPSEDAVTYFLTQSKEGYCEIFASAMAVLCREINIPARLVTGYAPGEWTPDPNQRGRGVCVVREKDLHAWVEVYFAGCGWVPFDPTSSRQTDSTFATSLHAFLKRIFSHISGQTLIPLSMIALMAATGLFLLKVYALDAVRRSVWWRALTGRHWGKRRRDEWWDVLYERAHRRVARVVRPKRASETPYEYAAAAATVLPPHAATALERLTHAYVNGAYRSGGPDESEVRLLLSLDAALKAALRAG